MTLRIIHLDPDYRRQPKTKLYCCQCQKDIRGAYRVVHVIAGGAQALHPADEANYVPDSGDMGALPIGPDCARKLGREWTHTP